MFFILSGVLHAQTPCGDGNVKTIHSYLYVTHMFPVICLKHSEGMLANSDYFLVGVFSQIMVVANSSVKRRAPLQQD